MHIHDVSVDVGDDVIALKSGFDFCGREFGMPTKNVLVENSVSINENFAIGSEMSGAVQEPLHGIFFCSLR